jgi:hypothetical protein
VVPTDGLDSEVINLVPGMAAARASCGRLGLSNVRCFCLLCRRLVAHSGRWTARSELKRRLDLAVGALQGRTYRILHSIEGYLTFNVHWNVEELLLLTLSTVTTRMISWLLMVRENFV